MLTRLRVKNFKCLLDVEVTLGPRTAFIGTNDSGKTSILEAIEWLGTLASTFDPLLLPKERSKPRRQGRDKTEQADEEEIPEDEVEAEGGVLLENLADNRALLPIAV